MKKYFALALGLFFLNHFVFSFADSNELLSFVQSQPVNHWNVMAQVASEKNPSSAPELCSAVGSNAIDIAGPILGLTSAGIDPVTCPINLVAKLESLTSTQIGSPELLNDDVFGVLALISAGKSIETSAVRAGVRTLLVNQQENGSLGFMPGGKDDADMTAAAVWALQAAGEVSAVHKAKQYLQTVQNPDGGFPAYGSKQSNPYTTAWALMAGVGGEQARSYLQRISSHEAAAYRVIALSGKTLPLRILSGSSGATQGLVDSSSAGAVQYMKIIGRLGTLCEGKTTAATALEVVVQSAAQCGLSYELADTTYGKYVKRIGADSAEGLQGWMFTINDTISSLGADQAMLGPQARVLWFYGTFNQTPPLFGDIPADRRSQDAQATIGLSAVVDASSSVAGGAQSEVRMEVDTSALDFGNIKQGGGVNKGFSVSNQGNADLRIGATVQGSQLFVQNLTLDSLYWPQYSALLKQGTANQVSVGLSVPSTMQPGSHAGSLMIWGKKTP